MAWGWWTQVWAMMTNWTSLVCLFTIIIRAHWPSQVLQDRILPLQQLYITVIVATRQLLNKLSARKNSLWVASTATILEAPLSKLPQTGTTSPSLSPTSREIKWWWGMLLLAPSEITCLGQSYQQQLTTFQVGTHHWCTTSTWKTPQSRADDHRPLLTLAPCSSPTENLSKTLLQKLRLTDSWSRRACYLWAVGRQKEWGTSPSNSKTKRIVEVLLSLQLLMLMWLNTKVVTINSTSWRLMWQPPISARNNGDAVARIRSLAQFQAASSM